jgi:acyl carrier protein phosphodiesterase
MNYLAHIYLARHNHDAMVGAFLGDFVKANLDANYNNEIRLEIQLHRRIDSYTDRHPVTMQARQLFAASTRRFAGILLDVFYDHLLAKNWANYHHMPLQDFVDTFYSGLTERRHLLPIPLAEVVPRMVEQDWLGSYIEFESVRIAVNRISRRLSKNGNLLCDGIQDLEQHYQALSADFDAFFSDLILFSESERNKLRISHALSNQFILPS